MSGIIQKIRTELKSNIEDSAQKSFPRFFEEKVFDYAMKNKEIMPRTALRYAIELMPKEIRTEAMRKE